MLDGRMWWEMRKSGEPEKKTVTPKQIASQKDWLAKQIAAKG